MRPDDAGAISIVMAAYNEEANIEAAVRQAAETGRRLGGRYEVVVVDDGSADRTAELALASAEPVRLVRHGRNRGYGAAFRSAVRHARFDVVLYVDADNQFDLAETERLMERLEHADVVVGHRARRSDPFRRRAAGWAWNRLVRVFFPVDVRDIDCGLKLFRRDALEGIELTSTGAMISTELLVALGRAGRTVAEVDVTHLPRRAGTPTGMKPRVVARAIVELLRMYPRLGRHGRRSGEPERVSPRLEAGVRR
jgi:glycosyltransferase involved in cell wall biosynthesis